MLDLHGRRRLPGGGCRRSLVKQRKACMGSSSLTENSPKESFSAAPTNDLWWSPPPGSPIQPRSTRRADRGPNNCRSIRRLHPLLSGAKALYLTAVTTAADPPAPVSTRWSWDWFCSPEASGGRHCPAHRRRRGRAEAWTVRLTGVGLCTVIWTSPRPRTFRSGGVAARRRRDREISSSCKQLR